MIYIADITIFTSVCIDIKKVGIDGKHKENKGWCASC